MDNHVVPIQLLHQAAVFATSLMAWMGPDHVSRIPLIGSPFVAMSLLIRLTQCSTSEITLSREILFRGYRLRDALEIVMPFLTSVITGQRHIFLALARNTGNGSSRSSIEVLLMFARTKPEHSSTCGLAFG